MPHYWQILLIDFEQVHSVLTCPRAANWCFPPHPIHLLNRVFTFLSQICFDSLVPTRSQIRNTDTDNVLRHIKAFEVRFWFLLEAIAPKPVVWLVSQHAGESWWSLLEAQQCRIARIRKNLSKQSCWKCLLSVDRNNEHVFAGKLDAAIPFLHLNTHELVGTSGIKSWYDIERVKK